MLFLVLRHIARRAEQLASQKALAVQSARYAPCCPAALPPSNSDVLCCVLLYFIAYFHRPVESTSRRAAKQALGMFCSAVHNSAFNAADSALPLCVALHFAQACGSHQQACSQASIGDVLLGSAHNPERLSGV